MVDVVDFMFRFYFSWCYFGFYLKAVKVKSENALNNVVRLFLKTVDFNVYIQWVVYACIEMILSYTLIFKSTCKNLYRWSIYTK